ncbi:hypothetical protein AUC70_12610 [Methyloceanibacter stevinii]|uniref:Glycoside hydrolase family 5 domain-containing protein n=1 Tax=Methyloceanibacter stevinii TaxID=1774970 RepID=A0A1E3VJF6_9HYPH|nr:glycoside hydrolase family 5 protein [Methyloceanibacter stevinii]ODR93670.1 hypothetical protein AUC70_12610 [Methyloceanibacter stevinii]
MKQPNPSRRDLLTAAAGCALSAGGFVRTCAAAAGGHADRWTDTPFLAGVNMAGADFGYVIPGVFGTNYTYPTCEEISYYRGLGFNVIRLPFLWERLQPDLYSAFDVEEWERFRTVLVCALNEGLHVILDPHNNAKRRISADGFSKQHFIGTSEVPTDAFIQFWLELIRRAPSKQVIYGLMNEPVDISAQAWFDIAQTCINAIRQTGATNMILAPGTMWTSAHLWQQGGNEIFSDLVDPIGYTAIEVHQYFDGDSSGRTGEAVSPTIGIERIAEFEAWARRHNRKAFLGEFGPSPDPVNLQALERLLEHISENRDVWIGWTAWAAGPWWPDDFPFKLDYLPSTVIPPQTRVLMDFARKR